MDTMEDLGSPVTDLLDKVTKVMAPLDNVDDDEDDVVGIVHSPHDIRIGGPATTSANKPVLVMATSTDAADDDNADDDKSTHPIKKEDERNPDKKDKSSAGAGEGKPKEKKKRSWKKPADKPKRPLSAYNLFFQLERERIITGNCGTKVTAEDVMNISIAHRKKKEKRRHRKTHGKISFADLARTIAEKWKKLNAEDKVVFEERAEAEKHRYKIEIEEWTKGKAKKERDIKAAAAAALAAEAHAQHTPMPLHMDALGGGHPSAPSGSANSGVVPGMMSARSHMMQGQGYQDSLGGGYYDYDIPPESDPLYPFASQGSLGTQSALANQAAAAAAAAASSHGNSSSPYMQHYQSLVEQKQMENELQRSQMDQMSMMMAYNNAANGAGSAGGSASSYLQGGSGSAYMQSYLNGYGDLSSGQHQTPAAAEDDYFQMASDTYNFAQRTLPSRGRKMPPHRVSLGLESLENLRESSPVAHLQQQQRARSSSAPPPDLHPEEQQQGEQQQQPRFYDESEPSFLDHHADHQHHMDALRAAALQGQQDNSDAAADGVGEMDHLTLAALQQQHQQQQLQQHRRHSAAAAMGLRHHQQQQHQQQQQHELALLDPHTGLSSPTPMFEDARDDMSFH